MMTSAPAHAMSTTVMSEMVSDRLSNSYFSEEVKDTLSTWS